MPTSEQIANTKRRRLLRLSMCATCKIEKHWDDFTPSPGRRPFGLMSQCKQCHSKRGCDASHKKRREFPELARVEDRRRNLKTKFGLTIEDYDLMHETQNGTCAICGDQEKAVHSSTQKVQRLAVDHDAKTGRVRALLCSNCNRGIGMFLENKSHLANAIVYLSKFEGE